MMMEFFFLGVAFFSNINACLSGTQWIAKRTFCCLGKYFAHSKLVACCEGENSTRSLPRTQRGGCAH